jgi:hypothetical protein
LQELHLHPDLGVNITFICANCLHLRQCLHPESAKKPTIPLPNYYWSYFDLRHEFEHTYKTSDCNNLDTMLESNYTKGINLNLMSLYFYVELNICPISEKDNCMRHIKHMELIVYQMLTDGKFVSKIFYFYRFIFS